MTMYCRLKLATIINNSYKSNLANLYHKYINCDIVTASVVSKIS